jgi:hypothetical protein
MSAAGGWMVAVLAGANRGRGGAAGGGTPGEPGGQPANPAAPVSAVQRPAAPRGWYLALAAGVFPPMVLGFVASGLANRLAFAGWGIVAAVGHAALLRLAWQRGWSVPGRAALALFWAAAALLVFGDMVSTHGEILDLGYRAVLWEVYSAPLAQPFVWRLVSGVGFGAAVVAAVVARRRTRP